MRRARETPLHRAEAAGAVFIVLPLQLSQRHSAMTYTAPALFPITPAIPAPRFHPPPRAIPLHLRSNGYPDRLFSRGVARYLPSFFGASDGLDAGAPAGLASPGAAAGAAAGTLPI